MATGLLRRRLALVSDREDSRRLPGIGANVDLREARQLAPENRRRQVDNPKIPVNDVVDKLRVFGGVVGSPGM